MPTFKSRIMDSDNMARSLRRIAHEILERNSGGQNLCFIGICRRGVPLAQRIAENVFQIENKTEYATGKLDIMLYRDDLQELSELPQVNKTEIPFDIKSKNIILVDDVIYTGRTVRAAIDAIMSVGRPASIQLAVLIDRGHRELPIKPDYIGKNVPTSKSEMVSVSVTEIDGNDCVELFNID